jgi:integrase
MASLNIDKSGNRRLQFKAPNGRRATLYLGQLPRRQCETVKGYVERLVIAAVSGDNIDTDTAAWLAKITDDLNGKLAAVGRIPKRQLAILGVFLDSYIAARSDVKPATAIVYGHTRRCLAEYFGAEKPLQKITAGDADAWRLWLLDHEKLADNTVRRRCGIAKQYFKAAMRKRLIAENPFVDLVAAVRCNDKRYYFITQDEARKVLDACPDTQWRLLFALSRFGGLRCPSEHLGLRWGDIDWERGRITIHSPKTEHHEGGESRQIPLFPELRPYLEHLFFEEAKPGTEYVITRYRNDNANLRTQLNRIIAKAGLKPWPKLFQNLRSTRATELVGEGWPEYKVCKWLGHSKLVAEKHYWQVTDADFEKAAGMSDQATQNPTHPTHVRDGKVSPQETQNPGFSGVYVPVPTCTKGYVGGTRLERATSTV